MTQKRLLLIAGPDTTYHHLHVARALDHAGWSVHLMAVDSGIARAARKILDVDKVHLEKRFVVPFLSSDESLEEKIYAIAPQVVMSLGTPSTRIIMALRSTRLPLIHIKVGAGSPKDRLFQEIVTKTIEPSVVTRVGLHQKVMYIAEPRVHYQTFLDFDTSEVLEAKQEVGIITYTNGVISKKHVVGVVASSTKTDRIRTMIKGLGVMFVDLLRLDRSDFDLPALSEQTAPVVYELLDGIVIASESSSDTVQMALWAMASGTVLVVPRTEDWVKFLGKGALYYRQGSLRELQACVEIITKSEHKRQEIREAASHMFEKRYSYSAIARAWDSVLEQVV